MCYCIASKICSICPVLQFSLGHQSSISYHYRGIRDDIHIISSVTDKKNRIDIFTKVVVFDIHDNFVDKQTSLTSYHFRNKRLEKIRGFRYFSRI